MTLPAGSLLRIEAALAEELGDLRRLIDVLERESAQLAAGLDDRVERLAAEKAGLSDRLTRLGQRRDALLAEYGLHQGIKELPARLPAASAPLRTWRLLRDAAREAKTRNEANGSLIADHRRHLHARLAVLTAAQPGSTYDPAGTTQLGAPRRALGAA